MSEPVCYGPWRASATPQLVIAPQRCEPPSGWLPSFLLLLFLAGLFIGRLLP